MSGGSADPFGPARDNLRDTIKWLATALGALAVALVAGLSLGSLADLEGRPLYLALLGGVVGIACVTGIIWIFLGLLIPEPFVLDDVLKDAEGDQDFRRRASELLPAELRNDLDGFVKRRKWYIEHIYQNRADPAACQQERKFIESTNIYADSLLSFGRLSRTSRSLKERQGDIGFLLLVGLAGLGFFVVNTASGGKSQASGPAAALPVELAPGKGWADLGQAFSGACGDVAVVKAEIVGVPQPGWLTLKLLAPEGCAGLSIDVPARITASPTAAVGVPGPTAR